MLVEWLFTLELHKGRTFEEAAVAVAVHPDVIELANKPHAGVALRTPEAIQKRYQRAIDEGWARTAAGLGLQGRPPRYADWEGRMPEPTEPKDPEAFAKRPRVVFRKRGD